MAEFWQNVVVGCGITGASMARLLAARRGERVLVVEQRSHVAGNCHDYFDPNGICIHAYGPHIFHTGHEDVWKFLCAFTDWHPYRHRVRANVDGIAVPLPFNLESLHMVFPADQAGRIEDSLLREFGAGSSVPLRQLQIAAEPCLQLLARFVHDRIYRPYTVKQWGVPPEQLPASVMDRVPVRVSRDDGYFADKYEGIPSRGYSAMVGAMLDHPLIELRLNTCFEQARRGLSFERLFHTGSIDAFMGFKLGVLPYRSMRLEMTEIDAPHFQSHAVVNFPEAEGYTRIIEFKHFLGSESSRTVIAREFPEAHVNGENEPFYPVENGVNRALHSRYLAMAGEKDNIVFLGRLGDYRYYNMDAAVKRALDVFGRIFP